MVFNHQLYDRGKSESTSAAMARMMLSLAYFSINVVRLTFSRFNASKLLTAASTSQGANTAALSISARTNSAAYSKSFDRKL
ncbi:hypothetical protein [Geoalkalibacter ferrihydriticus]|uniref:hypothetical protein n=1 Tax=Geoalkalibacter ferrihydriticus TaxID=392333 RepID=UPI0011146B1A|nr:hypothetical protein [Geoalkalibacter ferrihydriticus]